MPRGSLSTTVLAMTLLACTPAPGPPGAAGPSVPRESLARLAGRSVLFGHQSVGGNILDGVGRLVSGAGAGPRVVQLEAAAAPGGVADNARREEFNSRVRAAWGARVFDLARLESTGPSGEAVAVEWQLRSVPALSPAGTDDGGHLNARAQDAVARALVAHLAAATR
jgi:hypothetical protein